MRGASRFHPEWRGRVGSGSGVFKIWMKVLIRPEKTYPVPFGMDRGRSNERVSLSLHCWVFALIRLQGDQDGDAKESQAVCSRNGVSGYTLPSQISLLSIYSENFSPAQFHPPRATGVWFISVAGLPPPRVFLRRRPQVACRARRPGFVENLLGSPCLATGPEMNPLGKD